MTDSNTHFEARPATYESRIVDVQIEEYLTLFGAVEVSGTKWCGKTWSSLAHAASVTYVDRGANLQISSADPAYPLVGAYPHVIDEWQRVPAIWDIVRHAVDELSGEKGAWILTGSSTPRSTETAHSGAGRIGRIILHRIFLVDEVPGWVPASRSPKRMRIKPKRYFADPSLAVALLSLSPEALLQDWQTFGLVFENLVMRDLDVYARALNYTTAHPVRYYHDDSGLEVDAIIEKADGSWGALEIKVSPEKVEEAADNLIRMRNKVCENEKAKVAEPSFLAVVTGTGEAAYQRPDGVYVVPVRALGV